MAVFRVEKTKDYTVMSNRHLRDRALSLKAKGLLTLMLSLPENWDYTLQGLSIICKEGIDAIREGVREDGNGAGARDGCDEMEPAATERKIRFLRAEVLEQIEYDCIVTVGNRELLDELVELMVETLSSRRETLSISGEERPTWLVQERLRKLNAHHIEYVLNCLQSNRTKIRGRCPRPLPKQFYVAQLLRTWPNLGSFPRRLATLLSALIRWTIPTRTRCATRGSSERRGVGDVF